MIIDSAQKCVMGFVPLQGVFVEILSVFVDILCQHCQFRSELILHREKNVVDHIRIIADILLSILDVLLQLRLLVKINISLLFIILLQILQPSHQFLNKIINGLDQLFEDTLTVRLNFCHSHDDLPPLGVRNFLDQR